MLRMSGDFIKAVLLLHTLVYMSIKFNFITSFKPKEHNSEYKSVLVYFPSLFTVDLTFHSIEMKGTKGRRKNAWLNLQKINIYQNTSIKYLTNVGLLKIKENAPSVHSEFQCRMLHIYTLIAWRSGKFQL
jgi:hypothetical protein